MATQAGQPFDYRFVSLLTTSGLLFFPGVIAIGSSYGLWQGKPWAYVSCLVSGATLALYLSLLVYMKLQPQARASAAGDEVYFFSVFALAYLAIIVAVFISHRSKSQALS